MISALVTCWNYGHLLGACMNSMLAQSTPFDEILIVDDCSTDQTEVLASYYSSFVDGRVRVVRNDVRRGVVWNLNTYLPTLRSRWVVKVDADDWLDPSFVWAHEQAIERSANVPTVALFYSPARYCLTDPPNPRADLHGTVIGTGAWSLSRLRSGNFVHGSAVVLRDALAAVGGFPDVPLQEDWACWLKLAEAGFTGVPVEGPPLLNVRLHRWGSRDLGTDSVRATPGWRHDA